MRKSKGRSRIADEVLQDLRKLFRRQLTDWDRHFLRSLNIRWDE